MKLAVVLALVALFSIGCGDVPNLTGPTTPTPGSPCSLAGCTADQSPVEIFDNSLY